ncbi:nitrate reductase molybdenum cofactor assembly chaperone [Knoellia sp. p5-6-4]|uniref:nitrate reductase molybdenum cofactor assembly chaperone n=1 Tax=unclassified Knoellia TaxID=2618719 RepID=UPI0023DBEB9B|nr:nitrate reductase molybdenum cofactor assembly chaperone [Knoellia sp. p5-6-4]MDF2143417.1 nitrate reductase molybdenum cofactor assembly chaperone [Knoellia sp. p5-6-4]
MLGRTRHPRHPAPRLDDRQLATAWQVDSLLLDYPDEDLLARLAVVREAVEPLPVPVREPVRRFTAFLETTPVGELQRTYVETFDVTRRCCLYLTYFAHGDTRKRGLALVQFKQAYRKAGVEFDAAELPDHLSVVLEFGAAHDAETAWKLLNDHRAGIEMLRIALADKASPWHDVVLALVATLPELKGEDEEKMLALIAQGPPSEEVGLDLQPYAMDPRLNPRPTESVDLGHTIPVGAP